VVDGKVSAIGVAHDELGRLARIGAVRPFQPHDPPARVPSREWCVASSETVRPARHDDIDAMRAIERDAGRLFAGIGMDDIAEHEPPSVEALATLADDGRAWVVVDGPEPVGYIIVDVVDGAAHIEQVSVRLDHAHRGLGRALIDHVTGWAGRRGLGAITLTTFADVAWNAPYYERIGFRRLAEHELTPGLAAIRSHESEAGLDPSTRVCMIRLVPRPSQATSYTA